MCQIFKKHSINKCKSINEHSVNKYNSVNKNFKHSINRAKLFRNVRVLKYHPQRQERAGATAGLKETKETGSGRNKEQVCKT